MAEDIKENAMSGGTPARLRGLAANGNRQFKRWQKLSVKDMLQI